MDRKGYSTGFGWIFGLVLLFSLGLLYIVFNQTIIGYLNPAINEQATTTLNSSQYNAMVVNNNRFLSYWAVVPIVLIILVVIFIFINSLAIGNGT
jgi:uncharacterized membrane protein SpoIIM required for sporulation